MSLKIFSENLESKLFYYSMWWRIFYGGLRLILGVALLKLVNEPLSNVLYLIMGQELIQDPNDVLFSTINLFLQAHPLSVTYFLAIYLIFWGIVDIVLSINMLKHHIWAFPIGLYLIGFFILYEIYRFFHTHSLILLTVILIDIGIFWLIKREYKRILESKSKNPN
jgi:uncharacterized membrane protein